MTSSSPRTAHRGPRTGIVLWIMATLLLAFAFRAAAWNNVVGIGPRVHPAWLLMALCGNLAIQPFAALQWRLLLPPRARIRPRKMLSITALSSLAMSTAPMMLGHASTAALLARQPGICTGTALSVIALDQLTEGIVKLTVVLLAILLLPVPYWMRDGAAGLAVLVAVLLAGLLLAARR